MVLKRNNKSRLIHSLCCSKNRPLQFYYGIDVVMICNLRKSSAKGSHYHTMRLLGRSMPTRSDELQIQIRVIHLWYLCFISLWYLTWTASNFCILPSQSNGATDDIVVHIIADIFCTYGIFTLPPYTSHITHTRTIQKVFNTSFVLPCWNKNKWMNEWMNKWMNEWINEWMNEWINEWMSEWMSELNNEWVTFYTWMLSWMKRTQWGW